MNVILLEENDFSAAGHVRLYGRRAAHVRSVHRAEPGRTLRVGLLNGAMGTGVVTAFTSEAVEMEVMLADAPPAPLPVTLILALPRPKCLRRMLQAVTAMGVKRIVLLNAWRVEKSFWESPVLQPAALREQLILGLEQARDTALPEVLLRPRFKPFVEDELAEMMCGSRALLAHPPAPHECPRTVSGPVTLAVGPEGGFIPYEVEHLEALGFEAVSLVPRILRVETAVAALLGRLA